MFQAQNLNTPQGNGRTQGLSQQNDAYSPNYMVLAKPQPFNRTRGAAAKSFFGQILLHTFTYPDQFPTNSSKVAFDVSFMTDYAETWFQPYLMKFL
ncbi:uncharacterized protein VP01_642g3 [Puccinia sorghi]|uniref:DUF4939 domain-containing protein n=1 Tax=Puccinia sorghi TaxID=27349 RepID=A0A0L6UFT1_9BASI|nr:uncharacterized protein VP01_642g3 [Puccinia sorghi]